MHLVALFCLLFCCLSVPAWAQGSSSPAHVMEIFDQLPPDLQKEIIDEAIRVYDDCLAKDTYSQFHDCRCIGAKFFDARVLNGPTISQANLVFDIGGECVNQPGIAGLSYQECLDMLLLEPGDIEPVCTCYANDMAQSYARKPRADYRHIRQLAADSLIKCRRESP